MPARSLPRAVRAVLAASCLFTAAYAVQALLPLGAAAHAWWYDWAYLGFLVVTTAAMGARAVAHRAERAGWCLMTAGLGTSIVAALMWAFAYGGDDISWADVAWLAGYPLTFAGLAALSRPPGRRLRSGLWLDGVLGVLALSALLATLVIAPVRAGSAGASLLSQVVNVAYPLGDLLMVGILVARLALGDWRVDRRMALLVLGGLLWTVSDTAYLQTGYAEGHVMDLGWVATSVVWLWAAWLPVPVRPARPPRHGTAVAAVGFALIALVVLVVQAFEVFGEAQRVAIALAACALACAVARMAVTLADNERLLEISRREAATDELTGLGNRRALLRELAARDGRRLLVLLDLNGFKLYNDSYGHPAGDGLLRLIGEALAREVGAQGRAFRMGGDEFCALVRLGAREDPGPVAARLAASVLQSGDGFRVGASYGQVVLPEEAGDASSALGVADRRMYAHKAGGRVSAQRQSADVLLAMLRERHPDLCDHVAGVAGMAERVAVELGLSEGLVEQVRDAAALHDIGKMAIPDAILAKPDALDDAEWALVREHTVIGERVVGAAPALAGVSRMVRSSHERWDGGGYPDGLAAADIPIGARIIFVCDAHDAMTSQRPYGRARSDQEALAELRTCAGTQFDPAVVDAFIAVAQRSAVGAR